MEEQEEYISCVKLLQIQKHTYLKRSFVMKWVQSKLEIKAIHCGPQRSWKLKCKKCEYEYHTYGRKITILADNTWWPLHHVNAKKKCYLSSDCHNLKTSPENKLRTNCSRERKVFNLDNDPFPRTFNYSKRKVLGEEVRLDHFESSWIFTNFQNWFCDLKVL